jgi:uncharacterized protein (TIGR00645 family)
MKSPAASERRAARPPRGASNAFEDALERGIFASRWLLAPFYLGLILCLALLLIHFVIELAHFVPQMPSASASDVTLAVLGLVDVTFTANLVLIVIFSGYENFVSKIQTGEHDRPDWMTKVDFGGLKQKLITSIVAISAIQVLKAFMNIDKYSDTTKLAWLVGIHMVFVFSMLLLSISDRVGDRGHREHIPQEEGG